LSSAFFSVINPWQSGFYIMSFVYEPLPGTKRSIRLFIVDTAVKPGARLSLTLTTHTVTALALKTDRGPSDGFSVFQYTALSYMWGCTNSCKTILVNGCKLRVRQNLYNFLSSLHEDEIFRPMWAGAICINQEDVAERGHQVAIMGTVFKSADRVLAWTGTSSRSSYRIFELTSRYSSRNPSVSSDGNPTPGLELGPLADFEIEDVEVFWTFSLRPYWERTWIVQEFALSRKVIVTCGSYRCLRSALTFLLTSIHNRIKQGYHPPSNFSRQYHDTYAATTLAKAIKTPIWTTSTAAMSSLRDLLSEHWRTKCLDPRDKVYAIRALATNIEEGALVPDYGK
jgi:hypothetical protein